MSENYLRGLLAQQPQNNLAQFGGGMLSPVTVNPNLLAQAMRAREQPRNMLVGPTTATETAQYAGMVPGLGLLGVGGDISQYIQQPETRGILPYALTALGAVPFLGAMAKMAGPLPRGILKSQAGAIGYHGSPHTFPPTANNPLGEFDASKIGTGEGAQAYGHGTYIAESSGVGQAYQHALAKPDFSRSSDGVLMRGRLPEMLDEAFDQVIRQTGHMGTVRPSDAIGVVSKNLDQQMADALKANDMQWYKNVADMQSDLWRLQRKPPQSVGNLYKVDIPDEWLPKMLDWDKPLSQQSPDVRNALNTQFVRDVWQKQIGHPLEKSQPQADLVYKVLSDALGGQAQASEYMRSQGVAGIRYLDQGSRLAGELKITPPSQTVAGDWMVKGNDYNAKGVHFKTEAEARSYLKEHQNKRTSNYVVFPGMEKQVKILERK